MPTFNSFKDYGKYKGIHVNAPNKSKDKEMKCRKCGGSMRHLTESNVWFCHGCGNWFLAKKRT